MPKLTYRIDQDGYAHTAFGPDTMTERVNGKLVQRELPPQYFVFFDYASAEGLLILRKQEANVQMLNDYKTHAQDPSCARREDLAGMPDAFDAEGILDAALPRFLVELQGNLFGRTFLRQLARGLQFSAKYPLDISSPDLDLLQLLKERPQYAWREEYYDAIDADTPVARFRGQLSVAEPPLIILVVEPFDEHNKNDSFFGFDSIDQPPAVRKIVFPQTDNWIFSDIIPWPEHLGYLNPCLGIYLKYVGYSLKNETKWWVANSFFFVPFANCFINKPDDYLRTRPRRIRSRTCSGFHVHTIRPSESIRILLLS